MVAREQASLRILAHDDEQAANSHKRHGGVEHVNYLNGLLSHNIVGDIDQNAVLSQKGVESHFGLVAGRNDAIVVAQQLRVIDRSLAERLDNYARRAKACRGAGVKHVVVNEIHASAHIWHIAAKCFGWVARKVNTVDVKPIVGRKDSLKVGSLVVFLPLARQRSTRESLKRALTQGVERLRRVGTNGVGVLVVEIDILL